jgi:hypothetical protein
MKKVEKSYGLPLVHRSIQHLQHENDGFLFTSATAPYNLGTCETMLKWKPPHMNSIDFSVHTSFFSCFIHELFSYYFKIHIVGGTDGRPHFMLYVLRTNTDYAEFGELVPDSDAMRAEVH